MRLLARNSDAASLMGLVLSAVCIFSTSSGFHWFHQSIYRYEEEVVRGQKPITPTSSARLQAQHSLHAVMATRVHWRSALGTDDTCARQPFPVRKCPDTGGPAGAGPQRRTRCRSSAGAPSCLPITTRPAPSAGPIVSVVELLKKF